MIHKELKVWKKSIELANHAYRLIAQLPTIEKYLLGKQMRKCAVSVASNIAEGAGRNTIKEYIRFLNISNGSLKELETQYIIGVNQCFFAKDEQFEETADYVGRMLTNQIKSLKSRWDIQNLNL